MSTRPLNVPKMKLLMAAGAKGPQAKAAVERQLNRAGFRDKQFLEPDDFPRLMAAATEEVAELILEAVPYLKQALEVQLAKELLDTLGEDGAEEFANKLIDQLEAAHEPGAG